MYKIHSLILNEINYNETKGDLFAKYKNGKVKKIQKAEAEV